MNHAKYPPYPAYKPSGVEWLGEVPEGWIITEAKYYFEIVLGKMLQNEPKNDEDLEVPYLKALHVQWNKVILDDLPTMWASQLEIVTLTIQKGDLLVCEGGEVGRASIVEDIPPHNCIVQNALHLVKPKQNSNVKYLKYILSHISITNWFDVLCNRATIAHFTSEKFKELIIPLPPLDEQRAIATFLDRETARIDTLIAKMQRLLDLLAEKRQALITHAVTKGLDPHAPMKDSGVEWLGEVPQGWNVILLKRVTYLKYGDSLPKDDNYIDGYIKVFGSNGAYSTFNLANTDNPVIVIGRKGSYGKVNWSDEPIFASDTTFFIDPTTTIQHLRWMFYILATLKLDEGSNEAAVPGLNRESVYARYIPLPPLDEQRAIADYLDKQTARIDRLCQRIEEAIARLQERRVALITAAVTGQIDIRSEVHAG